MSLYKLPLDDIVEDLFFKLEELSERNRGHYCEVEAESKEEAARKILVGLRVFIEESLTED